MDEIGDHHVKRYKLGSESQISHFPPHEKHRRNFKKFKNILKNKNMKERGLSEKNKGLGKRRKEEGEIKERNDQYMLCERSKYVKWNPLFCIICTYKNSLLY